MSEKNYILAVDQSTSGTKALLFDRTGALVARKDLPHRQIINEIGWVEHDPMEIYRNTIQVLQDVVTESGVPKEEIAGLGISNQRETAMVWNRETGLPVYNAVVWQCARGAALCERLEQEGHAAVVKAATGLNLSPYFSAAKLAWVFHWLKEQNQAGDAKESLEKTLCAGTMDSWLVYKLTKGERFQTDYSNASRTQLFNIHTLSWDEELCCLFGVPMESLATVTDSNGDYGSTDLEGFFQEPIPIRGVFGDSHGALYGQGCHKVGMIKTTYGTGSSVMMNIGEKPIVSEHGAVTSLAYGLSGKVFYVLEGNINYTGATIKWLAEEVGLIGSSKESEEWAKKANPEDHTYLVPAFTGLGAPYFDSQAEGVICGMTRMTGKAELVRAAVDSIAYQITDILKVMEEDSGILVQELRVDGGPTGNQYLMQFQSDIAGIPVRVPQMEELSGIGAAYAAGIALGLYEESVFERDARAYYEPKLSAGPGEKKRDGWKRAVAAARGSGSK